ncbi:sensor histidine kinase [Deinococcus cellulosilyticus]|uniref:histidine kinase n=1 Tax=Deinococcus cellulosilyticus (strain DSM 18568 / NBRC 106333 / KACC 11606 / 5516J-15) TaxID=1223518 RepID=A0A511MVF4_DEIC1|nr:ATP-binding protein [Deinococcus cellulosilyticus]GEM44555.1 two-component sensor histidine kinase [Deinococcus cellulosilyticus NBRC 106333 = KACC 11606]
MRISLVWKVMGAFVLVSVLGVLSVGFFARYVTGQQFGKFQDQQLLSNYASFVQEYYRQNQSLEGLPRIPRNGPGQGPVFVVADPSGRVMAGNEKYKPGVVLPPDALKHSTELLVDGRVIGELVLLPRDSVLRDNGPGPRGFGPGERDVLSQISTAILYAMLATVVGSVVLGALLSRVLLGPVRKLSEAIQLMRAGQTPPALHSPPQDELGDVLVAFSDMSHEVHHANHLRRQMTADIAHDLQTPLTVLRGYLEAMQEGTLKPTPERLKTLHQEAQHLSELVADLRTLSLADAGELQLQKVPLDPAELLQEAQNTFHHLAETAGVKLVSEVGPDVTPTPMDPTRMLQVMKNLIGNALKHTPAGGQILLRAQSTDTTTILTVEDTGSGISGEALPLIFERFYRADESRSGHNSGLGLAICKSIVQAHGGTIGVESTPGEGTCFTMTLPR